MISRIKQYILDYFNEDNRYQTIMFNGVLNMMKSNLVKIIQKLSDLIMRKFKKMLKTRIQPDVSFFGIDVGYKNV